MKMEISIEEKARRYDEAYKKVAVRFGSNVADEIFSEYEESEDERIRKELICYFEKYPSIVIGPFNTKECIAWLEKQSTPQVRTGLEWVNTIDDACDKRYLEEYAHGEYCHEQSFKWGFQEGVDWLEKQGEQESVELEKEEKSRLMKKCVHRAYQQGYDTGFFMATTELEHKQEWSEEDNKMREGILDTINDAIKDCDCDEVGTITRFALEKERDWLKNKLKSIKDRVQPKPKQEWGEENKAMLNKLLAVVDLYYDRSGNDLDKQSCISWLKSLRPQSQWKPSDEQMDALEKECIAHSNYELCRLLEQLKKLREE